MSSRFAILPEKLPTLAIEGSDAVFPVNRVYCIGRNYAAHAREMGGDPTREAPFFFMKPADTVVSCSPDRAIELPFPSMTEEYHFEAEMVVALGKGGQNIAESDALGHVFGYGAGLDMTRRDRQDEAKATRRPWEVGKCADHSAPVGLLRRASEIGHIEHGAIKLEVNGQIRQQSVLEAMIWRVPEQIAILSQFFTLKAGDLIFTGTPEGVGAIERLETIRVEIDGLAPLMVRYV
jgi:fumarylpyruvate hydrolase